MKPIYALLIFAALHIFTSCDDEAVDNTEITAEDPIEVDSQLYNNIEGVTDNEENDEPICLDFNYAFTVFIFDGELSYTGSEIIGDDQGFSDFLGSLPDGYSISISYPISYTTSDGEEIMITNNEELKAVIDPCIEAEIIETGNGNCSPEGCVWRIVPNESSNNDYENAIFDINDSGFVSFYDGDQLFFGSWISFVAEYEYHINISLINSGDIGDDWNKDWKALFISSNLMLLENGADFYLLELECTDDNECEQFMFEECETASGSETAEFDLESYIDCFTFDIDISDSTITFHETIEDVENGTNALVSPYTNTENPQNIYVRIEDNQSGQGTFVAIQIAAVACEDD